MSVQAILINNSDEKDYFKGGEEGQVWQKRSDQDGDAGWQDLPTYDGTYKIIPSLSNSVTMQTSQKYMDRDIEIEAVPVYKTTNSSGGYSVIIGG